MIRDTARTQHPLIGRRGHLRAEGMWVPVHILDVRHVWNRTDYEVRPIGGCGQRWVSSERVELQDGAA